MGVIRDRWRIWERQQIIDELALTPTDLPSSMATDAEVAALASTNLTDSNLIARHKAVWTANTSWLTGDIVQITSAVANGYPLGLWRCITTHLGGTTFSGTSAGYWVRIAGDLDSVTAAGAYASFTTIAALPDLLTFGTITRDSNGAATSAPVVWPDGSTGTYTATTVSAAFPGAVDAYTVTKVTGGVTTTYTQPAVTRDTNGAVTTRPALTVA